MSNKKQIAAKLFPLKTGLKNLKSTVCRFNSDKDGSISVYSAVVLSVLTAFAGSSAVDIVRHSNIETQLQSAVETGVLAAASLDNARSTADTIDDYINANFTDPDILNGINITIIDNERTLNARQIRVAAEYEMPTSFMRMFGINVLDASAEAEAVQSRTNVEIALVLDVSSSMAGNRLAALKTAATEFIDSVSDDGNSSDVSVSLIPYGGAVNIGPDLFNEHAHSIGQINGQSNLDPSEARYDIGNGVQTGRFRFTNGGNCLELQDADFKGDVIPSGSRGQIPLLYRYVVGNPWCPGEKSEAIFNSNDFASIKQRIEEFSLSDGTGNDHGIAWGLNALTPAWRGRLGGDYPARPADFDDDATLKVAVIMTDGGITAQFRQEDPSVADVTNNGDNGNRQTVYSRGNSTHEIGRGTASAYFIEACETLRANNVAVFTIGFQLNEGSDAEALLKNCATVSSNHLDVDGLDIGAAFQAIRSSLSTLRVSG
ncbi:MAG: vWA domain-containing protein [Hyphomicrobiales bacterium]